MNITIQDVRTRLELVAKFSQRPVSANDFTFAEQQALGSKKAGSVFRTPFFKRLDLTVPSEKPSSNGRRVFLFQYIGA